MKEREKFGTRLGFILVSAGCAVGLGNVWKFPYICGEYGGAAFILIYLLFLVILGLPILLCEFAVGRGSQKSMAYAYHELEPEGSHWHHMKWLSIIGFYLLMMFYTMVAGWILYYAYRSLSGQMSGLNGEQIQAVFDTMLSSPGIMVFWTIVTVLLSFGVCALGLQNGIEKITKVMMSVLILLMIVLAIHSLLSPGAMKGVSFYLIPDFSAVKENGIGNTIFAAMSHAFFTLSVGMGNMEIFGSYLTKDRSLLGEGARILCVDTFVALMAGFIIIPACFSFGVEPGAGPSLLFLTLPNVFSNMTGGSIWSGLFFVFMAFAALSTVIAVFESIISYYMDTLGWTRNKAVAVNVPLVILLSLPAVLGYNVLSGFQPMGVGTTIMDLEDFLVSYNILPLGGLIFVLFCTRKNGWGWESFRREVNEGEGKKLPASLRGYMSFVIPAIIVIIYLKGYYDTFAGMGMVPLVFWISFAVALLVVIFFVAFRKKKVKKFLK